MRQSLSSSHLPRRLARGGVLALTLSLLGACSDPLLKDQPLPRQLAIAGCISHCDTERDRCREDARADYRDCQAGYVRAYRDYRWCLTDAGGIDGDLDCGYPGWSCAENLYGYCTNRHRECREACAAAHPPPRQQP
ncbi:hypothetical protein [Marichromatium bheemlicum]|uniref:Lipoprotein n=1 Tax=Marichromatium bheemlicum TaxID=365339 RepID=A0ABX1I382_9GAMM|nr:hypothetical protein [Marichromatium bheemlicum]NKN31933.1 hypothetical protein [Marichromatium bheemlicum]